MSIEMAKKWLSESACPVWLQKGIDWQEGGFFENLSLQAEPVPSAKRVMVQARQIFSSHVAMDLGLIPPTDARAAIQHGVDFILQNYSLDSGAFAHAVDLEHKPVNKPEDLYAQAFALFGLAHAYVVLKDHRYKQRAQELLQYLQRERKLPQGGYSEILTKEIQFEANPHMHLFEALLYWMEIDPDLEWKQMADEILALCFEKLIDPQKNLLAEHFDSQWKPLQEKGGGYLWEPGHHYEWVWLLGRYQKIAGKNLQDIRQKLYDVAESCGICSEKKSAYDEVDSELRPHKKTMRFWPQCERIKAALQMGLEVDNTKHRARYAQAADEAVNSLFKFLDVPVQGLWYDTWQESGEFTIQPAKASSLYHIIGALADYIELRPKL